MQLCNYLLSIVAACALVALTYSMQQTGATKSITASY